MAMTRKQVKEFVDNIENWRIIPGNQYVQVALLDFKGLHIAQIMYRHDINHWKYVTNHDDYVPRIEWPTLSFWFYDPENETMDNTVSRTYIENKIYERDHTDVLIEGFGGNHE